MKKINLCKKGKKIMENIKWTDIQYNVMFEAIPNIRDKAAEFEQCLEKDFPDRFNILQNMPNLPNSVPRMMASNINGLSINISAESISLTKNAIKDDDIEIAVFTNKAISLDALLQKIECKELFSGIILRGYIDLEEDPVIYIRKNFLKIEPKKAIYDIQTKFTFEINDKYYLNITLANFRKRQDKSFLAIEIDVNDRYRFNLKKEDYPYSDKEVMKNIKNLLEVILNAKIMRFIETGEFDDEQFKSIK